MWGLTDKYKRMDDFIKNTIDVAKKELDAVSPYSFDYTLNYSKNAEVNKGRKGRPTVTSITFFPKHNIRNESTDSIRKSVDPSMMFDRELYNMLKNKFGFDVAGIRTNISLLDIAQKEFDLLTFLDNIAPNALRANNPQGYVINAIRKHLSEHCGVIIQDNIILRDKTLEKKVKPVKGEPKSLSDILGDSI